MSSSLAGSRTKMIKLPASPRDSPSVRSPGGSASIRSPRHQPKKNTRRMQHSSSLGRGDSINAFNFSSIPEESEVVAIPHQCESSEGRDEANSPPKKNENCNSHNHIIMQMAGEVASETAARANIMMTSCAVELPADGTRLALQPKPATPKTTTTTANNNSSSIPRVRSKKVLVIDPGSGKKCELTKDDHSLTDKELHVYHQQKRSQQMKQQRVRQVGSSDESEIEEEEKTTATFQTNATGHTMVSALTEVSYGKKNKWGLLPLSPILFGSKAKEEGRDDEDAVEVGHYKQLLMDMRDPALMPADDYDGGNERFPWLGCLSPGGHNERELGPVPYRRIPMVIFPDELQQCMEDENETLMGMKLIQNADDFQAHVSNVLKGSKAYRMGIRKGDVLSFAVALSNVNKDDGVMADKIIKRLESVGMRTSYRELYDILLSKTTNSRPIGLVFRRWLRKTAIDINSTRINDEFEWSTDFLQALTIKSREFEFEQKVPFNNDESFDSDALSFVSFPNVSVEEQTLVSNYLNVVGNIAEYFFVDDPTPEDNFLSYRTLRSLVEQSVALAFVCQGNKPQNGSSKATGTGFAVVRSDDGSWSPPCFLSMMGNESHQNRSFKNANMIVICKKELLEKLMSGSVVHFNSPKGDLDDLLSLDSVTIGLENGKFHPVHDTSIAIKTSESQNQGAYVVSFGQKVRNQNIIDGQVLPPEQSVDFYGALRSLELPHSMHAHPVVPDKIEPYCNSDWSELNQYLSPRNGGMASVLKYSSAQDRHEIDIFTRRLKYYLMDGVPVHMIASPTFDDNEERELRLNIANPYSLSDSHLELARKRKPGILGISRQGNFSTSFDGITKLSRQPPSALNLDGEDKRRFFSLETDLSSGPIMMLVKNKRDAELLLAGLKLLLEQQRMLE